MWLANWAISHREELPFESEVARCKLAVQIILRHSGLKSISGKAAVYTQL